VFVPLTYVEEVFALLEKSAADGDSLEQANTALRGRVTTLESRLAKTAAAPVQRTSFTPSMLRKAAELLVAEGLVPTGYDLEKTAAAIEENPNRLLELAIKLATPTIPDGRPVKTAAPLPISGEPKLVRMGDHDVVDYDNFAEALTQR
jgi:hypothetical protein